MLPVRRAVVALPTMKLCSRTQDPKRLSLFNSIGLAVGMLFGAGTDNYAVCIAAGIAGGSFSFFLYQAWLERDR